MIAIDKRGRLGNQMFQYAFGVAVAQRLGTRQAYDTSELERYFALLESPLVRGATLRLARAYDRVFGLDRREVEADDREDPDEVLASTANHTAYGGHFYSEHFFRPAAAAVRRAFTIRDDHLERFRAKYGTLLDGGYVGAFASPTSSPTATTSRFRPATTAAPSTSSRGTCRWSSCRTSPPAYTPGSIPIPASEWRRMTRSSISCS